MARFKSIHDFLTWMRDSYFRAPGDPMAARINEFLNDTCALHPFPEGYLSDCGHTIPICGKLTNYTYCPFCGKHVKILS